MTVFRLCEAKKRPYIWIVNEGLVQRGNLGDDKVEGYRSSVPRRTAGRGRRLCPHNL
jgi:hypothetical protein